MRSFSTQLFYPSKSLHAAPWLRYAYGAAVISAMAWGTALGYGIWPLGWGAFLPLWVIWMYAPPAPSTALRLVVGPGLVVHAGAFLLAFPWVIHHASTTGVQAGLAAFGVLTLLYSLPLWAGGLLARRHRRFAGLAVWVGGWLLIDAAMQYGPWAFPWATAAHALIDSPGTPTLVRLGGPLAVTAALGTAHAIGWALLRASTPIRIGGGTLVVVLLGVGLAGPAPAPSVSSDHTVWTVQPALSPTTWAEADRPDRRRHLEALTRTALDTTAQRPDLIVWPETALHPADTTGLQSFVTDTHIPLLSGAVAATDSPGQVTNATLLWRPNSHAVHRYDKHHLVPMVEYVPGMTQWERLRLLQFAEDPERRYVRGPGPTTLTTETLRIGPLVCFESLFGGYVARLPALTDIDVLVTVAQTGWWQQSQPAHQHSRYSRLRAFETGRPLLIASVSGPSTLIHPSGVLEQLASYNDAAVASAQLPTPEPPGLYVHRSISIDIAWTAVGLLLVLGTIRRWF